MRILHYTSLLCFAANAAFHLSVLHSTVHLSQSTGILSYLFFSIHVNKAFSEICIRIIPNVIVMFIFCEVQIIFVMLLWYSNFKLNFNLHFCFMEFVYDN